MAVASTLNGSLDKLGQRSLSTLPVALRAFQQETGTDSPIAAAQYVARRTLGKYFTTFTSKTSIISLRFMCEMLGIELLGCQPTINARAVPEHVLYGREFVQNQQTAAIFCDRGRPIIELMCSHLTQARLSVAHEIGHFLIHARDGGVDWATFGVRSTPDEEEIAEYIGRLLLLPGEPVEKFAHLSGSEAEACVRAASASVVSIHSVSVRCCDPDQRSAALVKGAIFWSMNRKVPANLPTASRLTPYWHLCPAFVPIYRCTARRGSLVTSLADSDNGYASGRAVEDVQIGAFSGRYMVEGFAWGSVSKGTRRVLSLFHSTTN